MLHLGEWQNRTWQVLWISLLLVISSCSSDKPGAPLVPTQGRVYYQGRPAAGATVILHPINEQGDWKKGYPSGSVAPDGSVKIQTAGKWDGAPAGEYSVVVVWTLAATEDERTSEEGIVDKLAGKYTDPANSPWKIKVEGTGCDLPRIDLQ